MTASDAQPGLRQSWRNHLTWWALLVSAWLVFEFTTDPVLGALVASIKFGLKDLETGRWIRRWDPNRDRGCVCFWFYLAIAVWKIAISAFAGIILLVIGAWIGLIRIKANNGLPAASIFLEYMLGLAFTTLITGIAMVLALWRRVRVWLDPGIHQARKFNVWPPPRWGKNSAEWLIMFALAIFFFFTSVLAPCAAAACLKKPEIVGTVLVTAPMLNFVVLVALHRVANRHIIAKAPVECWGDGSDWHRH